MIYRFRVILDNDTEDDVFRDLEIRETDTMEDLHNIITQSFGFDGMEMASFYISDDEWNQGEEIAMMDMSEAGNEVKMMSITVIKDVVHEASPKLIYVYDFLNLWTFFVELMETAEKDHLKDYPSLIFSHGEVPETPPNKDFVAQEGFHNDLTEDDDSNENEFDEDQFY